eukprot:6462867-Amphidinium_carterae.1
MSMTLLSGTAEEQEYTAELAFAIAAALSTQAAATGKCKLDALARELNPQPCHERGWVSIGKGWLARATLADVGTGRAGKAKLANAGVGRAGKGGWRGQRWKTLALAGLPADMLCVVQYSTRSMFCVSSRCALPSHGQTQATCC